MPYILQSKTLCTIKQTAGSLAGDWGAFRGMGLLWVVTLIMLAGGAEVIFLLLNLCVSDKWTEHTIAKPQGSRKENEKEIFLFIFFAKESLLQEANGLDKFMSLPLFISGTLEREAHLKRCIYNLQ